MSSNLDTDNRWLPLTHIGVHMASEVSIPHKTVKRICCLGAGYVVSDAILSPELS